MSHVSSQRLYTYVMSFSAKEKISKLHSENLKAKRQLVTARFKGKDNSKLDRKGTRCKQADWVHLAQCTDKLWASLNKINKFNVFRMSDILVCACKHNWLCRKDSGPRN
jgi:hypothetical protein